MNVHDRDHRVLTAVLGVGLTPIEPAPSVRASWLERLRGPERFTPFASEVGRAFGVSTADALDALRSMHEQGAWIAGRSAGSAWMTTPALSAAGAVITRLPAGTRIGRHTHERCERTYVLNGTLVENQTTTHRAGALITMRPGDEHELAVSADAPCIVVFAQ